MTFKFSIIGVCFLFSNIIFSQGEGIITSQERLNKTFKELRKAKQDIDKITINNQFKKDLKIVLETYSKDAMKFGFDSLQTMGKIISPDNEFRLFNWNIEMNDKSQLYYCLVLRKNGKVIELSDRSDNIDNIEFARLDNRKWFGALYYKIIPIEKGGKKYYTLLGWDGNSNISTKKIIEVMYFSGSKKVKFGAPIFKIDKQTVKTRIVFEFAKNAYMSVKHDKQKKSERIIFAHLAPSSPNLEGHYQYYYPDLSYDAFEFVEQKWVLVKDIDVKNPKSKKDKKYHDPRDDENPNRPQDR